MQRLVPAGSLRCKAKAGQIIVSQRTYGLVQEWVDAAPIDDLQLKGFNRPIPAMEIRAWREADSALELPPAAAGAGRKG